MKKESKNSKKLFFQFHETMMSIKMIIVLISTILFVIRYDLEQKTEFCSVDELKESIDNNSFVQLNNKKIDMVFGYQKFNSQCYEINLLLAKYGYFLRVFELKGKFHQFNIKNPKKTKYCETIIKLYKCKIQRLSSNFD